MIGETAALNPPPSTKVDADLAGVHAVRLPNVPHLDIVLRRPRLPEPIHEQALRQHVDHQGDHVDPAHLRQMPHLPRHVRREHRIILAAPPIVVDLVELLALRLPGHQQPLDGVDHLNLVEHGSPPSEVPAHSDDHHHEKHDHEDRNQSVH